ncbi:MAG: glycosyltransferase family 4 protein [Dehalococcoidia bacterium]
MGDHVKPDSTAVQRERGADPSRILFVEANEDGTTGGSHRSLFELARRLDRERFQPVVLFYQQNPFVDRLRAEGITVLLYDEVRQRERAARTSGRFMTKLLDVAAAVSRRRDTLRKHRIDLVHINNSPRVGCDDWLPACRLLRIPIVASVRGDAGGPQKRWQRFLFKRFDRVMPVARWLGEAMSRAGISAKRIRVVYNGVDTHGIRGRVQQNPHELRSRLGIRAGDLFAVMVANIRPWKGQHVALDAFAQARGTNEGLKLALVGATGDEQENLDYERRLRAKAAQPALRGAIHFLGARSDVPDLFAAADVAIHASVDPEPFGLVIVEAMATGTPVIASNRGGPVEIVTDESGFLHDPSEPSELANILSALSNSDVLGHMSKQAIERADQFDIGRTVSNMQRLYDEVLG